MAQRAVQSWAFRLGLYISLAGLCASCGADSGQPNSEFHSPSDAARNDEAEPPITSDAAGASDAELDQGSPPFGNDGGSDAPIGAGGATQIVVSAGMFDRTNAIVSFAFPAGAGKSLVLHDAQGSQLPLQVDKSGNATFILPTLRAGMQATFDVVESPQPAAITAVKEADGIRLTIGSTTLFRYQMQGKLPPGIDAVYLRGGYIHPLYTPAGIQVTDDYPPDHRHHHGIWGAWTKTMFNGHTIDFWIMGERTAKVDFESLEGTWDGPVHAGLRAHHVYVDLAGAQPTTALREVWVVTAYKTHQGAAPYFIFDVDSVQETATNMPVVFEQYLYGGFAIRGAAEWRTQATFLTSEGKDRISGDGTNARWCYIGGLVNAKQAGYAVLGHPTNFRAPQPLRIHPDNPYATFSPVKDSGFSIVPGMPYRTRLRFVATDGPPDKALLDRMWNDFATPPAVSVRSTAP